jgi:glycosyltransferase involved in cell wall biosynthesis
LGSHGARRYHVASMARPAISVVMPVHNTHQWVGDAVRSILSQTLGDFELIVIDDGSTDDTLAAVKQAMGDDRRAYVISRANKGLVTTLNEGLERARGEFIARMDGDDLCEPSRFEQQIERLRREPALVALGTCAYAIDPEGRTLGPADVPLTHEAIEERHLDGDSCIYHPSVMLRANAVRAVGGYRPLAPVEDFDLWLRLGEVGRLANLADRLFTWRRTLTGIVASQANARLEVLHRVMDEAWQRRGLPGKPSLPAAKLQNQAELFLQWGWMALDSGERRTAKTYAVKALRQRPFAWPTWKLAMHAMRR